MRLLVVALAAIALLALGCSNACQDLGGRLCDCSPAGTTKASCVDSVKADIQRLNPNKSAQEICSQKLDTCWAHTDPVTRGQIDFCDWINGRCGKAACGLSEENYSDLSDVTKFPDPNDPTLPLCPAH